MFATKLRPVQSARWPRQWLYVLVAWLLAGGNARAEVVTLDATHAPIVRINIQKGDVSVRTWDRRSVQVVGDASLSIVRRTTHEPAQQNPVLIPQAQASSRDGPLVLPAESFVVSSIPAGPREAIVVRSGPEGTGDPVIVTVPNDSVYVFAFARSGNLDVRDYRGGTFVGFTGPGRLVLAGVGGTIFAQTRRGALTVTDSATDRLRARSLFGNMTFERCRSQQIEATSIDGSIVYDGGGFVPGLARFESSRGNVAIGTDGGTQLGARVGVEGRVFTNFERTVRVQAGRAETNAVVDGGGPLVTAATQSGNVYLYDGTLRTRERLPSEWQAPLRTLQRPQRRFLRRSLRSRRPVQPRAPVRRRTKFPRSSR